MIWRKNKTSKWHNANLESYKQMQHITCVTFVRPKILESSFNIIQLHQPIFFFMTFPSAPLAAPWLTRRELRELRRSDLATKRGLVWRYGCYKVIMSCNMYTLHIVYMSIYVYWVHKCLFMFVWLFWVMMYIIYSNMSIYTWYAYNMVSLWQHEHNHISKMR